MFKASSDLFSRISSALAKKIDRNAQELTDREIRIFADHLVGSIKGLESRIEELEAEKSKLENDLADAEAARVQERDDRIAAETEVEDLRAEKSRLEKDLDATNSKLNRLNSLVDRLNKDNGDSQKEINRLRAENAELFGDKNNLEIQMRGLREDSVPRKDYDYLKSRLSQEKTRATVAETRLAAEAQARPEKEAVESHRT